MILGYMTEKEARSYGMTHEGRYYGIAVWMAPDHPDNLVAVKWMPLEWVMEVFHYIEGFVGSVMGYEPGFHFNHVRLLPEEKSHDSGHA